jgi:putative ABC transport system substrate-binding protein
MSKKIVGLALCAMLIALYKFADAQQPQKVPRIGLLISASSAETAPFIEAFRQGLRDLGYIEGKNIVLEIRGGEARRNRITDLAAELVSLNVDVIVAAAEPAIRAAKKATSTIPIVIRTGADPVRTGLVASLARPGGNITGVVSSDFYSAENV